MYSDRLAKNRSWILWLLLVTVFVAAVLLLLSGGGQELNDSSARAIRSAVQRSALQCYVVEGAYPPDLEYLEDNYGLQINLEDFYVTYEAFASNLPPSVVVTKR